MLGEKVKKFEVGDEVYSRPDMTRNGTYAEQVVVNENIVAKKPKILTFEEAASIPLVGLTAWTCLISFAEIKKDDRVLIQAGAGGVGSFSIQLAKNKGSRVAVTSSGDNVDLLKELGADQVINYENENFEDVLGSIDVVLDTLGGENQNRSFNVLKKGVVLTLTTTKPDEKLVKEYDVKAYQVSMKKDADILNQISDLIEKVKIRPVVKTIFDLSEVKEAHKISESGHARGKIVLRI